MEERSFYSHSDVVRDLYIGRGRDNPSITERMQRMEQIIEQMVENEKTRVKKQNQIQLLVWAALITGLANLVFSHLK